jgi:ribose transport system substrate-binding protein
MSEAARRERVNVKIRKSHRIILILISSIILLTAIFWVVKENSNDDKSKRGTIGFTGYDLSVGFFASMEKGIKFEVEKLGYDYVVFDQESDETKQIATFKELIRRNVDAIIVSPINPDLLAPLVDQAHENGIPVIVNDIGGGNSDYDAIVVSDNWQGGQLAADYLTIKLKDSDGSKKVAIIACEPTAVYASIRGDSFQHYIEASGYEVVSNLRAYSRQEDGYARMKEILETHPDIEAVFAENDPMAVGAASALAEMNREDIILVGFNGDQIAIDAISNGLMEATVMQNPTEMGRITAQLADRIIQGKQLDYSNDKKREIYVNVSIMTKEELNKTTERSDY